MMRYFFLMMFAFALFANAQNDKLERYPAIPTHFNAVFYDHVKNNRASVAKTEQGQYFGQVTADNSIYGYGTYYTEQNGVIYGQYRNGEFVFGIKMDLHTVVIGNNEHYICYDLTTSEPLYIMKSGKKQPLDKTLVGHRFESLTYANGDKYIGETVNGKRDGYGLYFYKNGTYYYGQYKNNERCGVGATFHTNNIVTVTNWEENK